MIRADMIPPEVVEAAAKADYEMTRDEALADHGIMASSIYCPWEDLSADGQEYYKQHARASIAAAFKAWPGSYSLAENDSAEIRDVAAFILPLPTENTNV